MSFYLEIGSGKIDSHTICKENASMVVCVDRSYSDKSCNGLEVIERTHEEFYNCPPPAERHPEIFYSNIDIFTFLDTYKYKFHYIEAHRIFEHMFYDSGEIGRLLAALWSVAENPCQLSIVVPNALSVYAKLYEFETKKKFKGAESERLKLLVNTELQNTRSDPHGSTWTPALARSYIESEGTWQVLKIHPNFSMEGRDIYMKIDCVKLN